MKRLVLSVGCILTLSLVNISLAQTITMEMQQFLRLAAYKNGDQKGMTSDEVAKFLKIDFAHRKSNSGRVIYETSQVVVEGQEEVPLYRMTVRGNSVAIVSLSFTEPVVDFLNITDRLRGYKRLTRTKTRADGIPVYYFEGEDVNSHLASRKFWIKVTECSTKPTDKCIRTAELIFAKKSTIL